MWKHIVLEYHIDYYKANYLEYQLLVWLIRPVHLTYTLLIAAEYWFRLHQQKFPLVLANEIDFNATWNSESCHWPRLLSW